MNAPLRQGKDYWGTKTDFASLLEHVRKIGPILEENAEENDKLGRLNEATFAALKPLRMSHIFAGEEIGGAQLSPTQGLELIEAITYHSGSRRLDIDGACLHRRDVGGVPARHRDRPPLCAGHGEPLFRAGHADRHAEEGRRRLSAERQMVLCERHLPRHLHPHGGASRRRHRAAGQGRQRRRDRAVRPCPGRAVRPAGQLGRAGPARDGQHRLWRQGCVHPRRHGVPDPDGASRSA